MLIILFLAKMCSFCSFWIWAHCKLPCQIHNWGQIYLVRCLKHGFPRIQSPRIFRLYLKVKPWWFHCELCIAIVNVIEISVSGSLAYSGQVPSSQLRLVTLYLFVLLLLTLTVIWNFMVYQGYIITRRCCTNRWESCCTDWWESIRLR